MAHNGVRLQFQCEGTRSPTPPTHSVQSRWDTHGTDDSGGGGRRSDLSDGTPYPMVAVHAQESDVVSAGAPRPSPPGIGSNLSNENNTIELAESVSDMCKTENYEDNGVMLGFRSLSIASGPRHVLANVSGFVVKGVCVCP